MTSILLRNGHVIDPANGRDEIADIAIDKDVFVAPENVSSPELELDLSGKLVFPGLVDLWARPGHPSVDHTGSIVSETTAAAYGGITTVCVPPDTKPVLDQTATVELIRGLAKQAGTSRVRTYAALTQGLEGLQLSELNTLMEAGCIGASQADASMSDLRVLRRAMEYSANSDIPMVLQPADASITGNGCAHEGLMSQRLGLAGIPAAAETVAIAQIIELMVDTGARVHLSRLSTARGAQLVAQAKADGLNITADASIFHLLLADTALTGYNKNAKLCPPLRSEADRAGLQQALLDGTLDGICSDHRPVSTDNKAVPFDSANWGASSFDSFAPLLLALGKQLDVNLSDCIAWATNKPAKAMRLPFGTLSTGAPADLCVFDPNANWTISANSMHSSGKNSPWSGMQLSGKCDGVVLRGEWLAAPASP